MREHKIDQRGGPKAVTVPIDNVEAFVVEVRSRDGKPGSETGVLCYRVSMAIANGRGPIGIIPARLDDDDPHLERTFVTLIPCPLFPGPGRRGRGPPDQDRDPGPGGPGLSDRRDTLSLRRLGRKRPVRCGQWTSYHAREGRRGRTVTLHLLARFSPRRTTQSFGPNPAAQRVSVGSTEASASLPARVGGVRPKHRRASLRVSVSSHRGAQALLPPPIDTSGQTSQRTLDLRIRRLPRAGRQTGSRSGR
jgi:hypothetical protein